MDTHNNNKFFQANNVCQSVNISEIYNKPIKPTILGIPIIAKVPVILSYTEVQLHIETMINLDSSALCIRDSLKEINITDCKLYDLRNNRYGKLHLKGYIRESLEYSESDAVSKENGVGKVRNIIVTIPFECSTKADYITPPVFKTSDRLIHVEVSQIHEVQNNCFSSSTPFQAGNSSQGLMFELEEFTILDSSITTNDSSAYQQPIFDNLMQDIIVSIKFSLMQKQFVRIMDS